MHSESSFNAAARNLKGSGATGLIQFMPQIAKQLGTTTDKLHKMSHLKQLDYVYDYLHSIKQQRKVSYTNLTNLYLAILYPAALGNDPAIPSMPNPLYNTAKTPGLDENKDGKVTIYDIDQRLKRMYPTAYNIKTTQTHEQQTHHSPNPPRGKPTLPCYGHIPRTLYHICHHPDAFIMYMGLYDEVYVQLKRKLIETKPKYNLKLYYHHCAMLRYWYEDALKFLQFNDEAVNFMKRIAQQATDFRKHLPTKPQNDK